MPQEQPGPKDGIFFLTILMTMKNKPEVDWNLVAQKTGYNNAKVAATRFGQMKKRFAANANASSIELHSPSPSTSNSTPSSPSKKRGGSGTNTSPSKVVKRSSHKGRMIIGKVLEKRFKEEEFGDGIRNPEVDGDGDVHFEVYEDAYA